MFPRETTDPLTRRSLAELLRDALGTAVEFATLGEATFDQQAAAKVRYLRPEEAAIMQDERPSDDRHDGPSAPAVVGEHPHRLALRRPSRPRRPGAVPPRAPVCTMPVAAPIARAADGISAPAPHAADSVVPPAAPCAHRHTPRD